MTDKHKAQTIKRAKCRERGVGLASPRSLRLLANKKSANAPFNNSNQIFKLLFDFDFPLHKQYV